MAKRSRNLLAAAITVVALGAGTQTASTTAARGLFNVGAGGHCPAYAGGLEICSGQVASFDGSTLDVDVTKPLRGRGAGSHPLIVMLHGFANDKHEWESVTDAADGGDKWHWNSHWFASHGYYVLNYTARGFRTDQADAAYQPRTPAGSSLSLPNGTIHLKSREFEIRDTQWLAALAADSFSGIDPNRVAVTGGSYGGGESWLQASQPRWDFPNQVTGGALPVLQLQVAVPKYPWTDLSYSLSPNGHPGPDGGSHDSAQQRADKPDTTPCIAGLTACNPLGVLKLSYVSAFYALGTSEGMFESGTTTTPSQEGPIDVTAWNARAVGADPYDTAGVEDPIMTQLRRGLTEFRSSYYQDEQWAAQASGRKVAVFSIQGWTDDLFPAVESFRQFRYLKRLDPRWPVAVGLGDVGHSRAQNRASTWRWLNTRANRFLRAQISRSHEQATWIASEPTRCGNGGDPPRVKARTTDRLARGTLAIAFAQGGTLASTGGSGDPDGPATDPVLGQVQGTMDCRESTTPTWPGRHSAVSQPLPENMTYIGLGASEGSVHAPGRNYRDAQRAPLGRRAFREDPLHRPRHVSHRRLGLRHGERRARAAPLRKPLAVQAGPSGEARSDPGRRALPSPQQCAIGDSLRCADAHSSGQRCH